MTSGSEHVNLYVEAPVGNGYTSPQAMSRVNDHLISQFPAMMKLNNGMPQQEPDGTWEISVRAPEMMRGVIKRLLTGHYGLTVVREEVVSGQGDLDDRDK